MLSVQVLFKIGVEVEENLKEPSTCLFTAQGDWGMKDPLKCSWSTQYSNSNIQEQLQTLGGGGSFLPVSTWQITVVVSLWSFLFTDNWIMSSSGTVRPPPSPSVCSVLLGGHTVRVSTGSSNIETEDCDLGKTSTSDWNLGQRGRIAFNKYFF